ncbi:MAG: hypothetical protein ACJZ2N_01355 [Candidatus Poseidoniales archaeon]
MNLEEDYKPFVYSGFLFLTLMTATVLGGVDIFGIWLDAMYPIFVLFATASFAIAWIRWQKKERKH